VPLQIFLLANLLANVVQKYKTAMLKTHLWRNHTKIVPGIECYFHSSPRIGIAHKLHTWEIVRIFQSNLHFSIGRLHKHMLQI